MSPPPHKSDEIAFAIGSALEPFPNLLFGFLFGSAAAGRLRSDSDVDVALYQASAGHTGNRGRQRAGSGS